MMGSALWGYHAVRTRLAGQYVAACRTRLKLPEFDSRPRSGWRWYTPVRSRWRDCLIAEGYTVSEPPSLDTFIESHFTSNGPWSADQSVPGGSEWIRFR